MKNHKYMQIKLHNLEQSLGQRGNQMEFLSTFKTNENKNTTITKFMWCIKSKAKRKVVNAHIRKRNISNKQPNFTLQGIIKIKAN